MATTSAQAADPFFRRHGVPIGIQLYTLGPDLAKDLDGTLKQVGAIGYRAVETAGLLGRTPAQMRGSLDAAGLSCTSVHVQGRAADGLTGDLGKLAEMITTLGARTAVMPSPVIPERLEQRPASGEDIAGWFRRVLGQMSADDWKWNADFLNEKAVVLKRSGITLGYHNHNFEFAPVGSTTGMEILLGRTDPSLVTLELDLGWVAAAGLDPAKVLQRYKGRVSLVHVKDIQPGGAANFALRMEPTEVGAGALDWKMLLPAAWAAGVRGFYVEQEPPFARPRIEAAKLSHDFLAGVAA